MGQLKHRFYILGLSLLVLVIALAGLLGVLDILGKPTPASNNNGDSTSTAAPPPTSVKPAPSATATPKPSLTPTTTPTPKPPDSGAKPGFKLSLPTSFNLDPSKITNPGLSLEPSEPVHLPVLDVSGAENTNLLKSITASFFDGEQWLPENMLNSIEYNGDPLVLPELDPDRIVIDNITVSMALDIISGNMPIPVSLYPVSVNSSEPLLYFPDDMTFLAQEDFPEEYIFDTIHFIFSRQALANADLDLIQQYLQLPDNITPRTYELAEYITGGIESPYLMAKAIEEYLKTNYTYDFDFPSAPEGWEPNDWFLFQEQSGVCTNFNSAFVILCRAAGIPARMAGGFAITPQAVEQTVYADQAHAWAEVKFKDTGWQTFDATGSPKTDLIPTNTNITSAGPVTQKGHEFTVSGAVWASQPAPVEGALVEILVNKTKDAKGAVLVGRGIVAKGRFDIKAIIPADTKVGDYQVMAHCLGSALYGESWSDPSIKVVTGTVINLIMPPQINAGDKLALSGTLKGEFGEILAEQRVAVTLDDKTTVTLITDRAGSFTWEKAINDAGEHNLKVHYAGTDYYLAASREQIFRALAPATLEISANSAVQNKPAIVSGFLYEKTTGNPLPGRSITVLIDGGQQENQPVTASDGTFDYQHKFKEPGSHEIEVRFGGDTDYTSASASTSIVITAGSSFSARLLIFAGAAVIALGAGLWFLYRRLKNRPPVNPAENLQQIVPEPQSAAVEPWQSSDTGLQLSIAFPQIIDMFQDVWGTGDEFIILLRFNDESGNIKAAPLDLMMNGQSVTTVTANETGKAELKYIFPEKGLYNLTVKYEAVIDGKKASAGRPLRIVDYREEIVNLFNTLIEEFRSNGIAIPEKATPREIQELATKANTGIPEKALEIAVTCFEETDYSLHIITRENYEYMYMAQKEIRESGNKPAGVA